MDTILMTVFIPLVCIGAMFGLVALLNWYGGTQDDWAQVIEQEHQDAERDNAALFGDDLPPTRLPFQVPSMGGTPAEAHLLVLGMETARERRQISQQHKQSLPQKHHGPGMMYGRVAASYCPECEMEKWRKGQRVPHVYPAGIPRLCDVHSPTIVMSALKKGESF